MCRTFGTWTPMLTIPRSGGIICIIFCSGFFNECAVCRTHGAVEFEDGGLWMEDGAERPVHAAPPRIWVRCLFVKAALPDPWSGGVGEQHHLTD